MKKAAIVLAIIFSSLLLLCVSCGKGISGKYYFTDESYNYMLDAILKESGVNKEKANYQQFKEEYKVLYTYETVEYRLCSGKDLGVEFKGKNVILHVSRLNYSTNEYVAMDLTAGTYKIDDGKIYVSSEANNLDNEYIGYIKDGVFWFAPEGDELVCPLYIKK